MSQQQCVVVNVVAVVVVNVMQLERPAINGVKLDNEKNLKRLK